MEEKGIEEWDVDDVVAYLESLSLGHVAAPFKDNAVDGRDLIGLEVESMVTELHLTPLQARKVKARLPVKGSPDAPKMP